MPVLSSNNPFHIAIFNGHVTCYSQSDPQHLHVYQQMYMMHDLLFIECKRKMLNALNDQCSINYLADTQHVHELKQQHHGRYGRLIKEK